MQVDFGQALAVIGGAESTVHCLVASFPHSNMRYAAALPGENAVVRMRGAAEIFEHIGMVPPLMVFDATPQGAAHRVAWDRIRVAKVFQLFCEHHRIEVRFCKPSSGWEKGKRGERGRLPAPQSHGPAAQRREPPAAHPPSAVRMRRHRRRRPLPSGRTIRDMSPTTSRTCCHCPEPGSTPSNGLSAGRTGRVTSRSTPTATSRARRGAGGRCRSACARSTWRSAPVTAGR